MSTITIYICGVPGAGKTTIAKAIAFYIASLGALKVNVQDDLDIAEIAHPFWCESPEAKVKSLMSLMKNQTVEVRIKTRLTRKRIRTERP
jgi:adenylate kinase family enzyme